MITHSRRFRCTLSHAAALTLSVGIVATPVMAATATGNMAVSANIVASCVIGATAMAFGAYTGAILDATSTLTITCTNTVPYTVALNAGTGPTPTVAARAFSVDFHYSIFKAADHAAVWGIIVGDQVAGTGTGTAQTLTAYGRIPAAQTAVTAGSYTDTITATLSY